MSANKAKQNNESMSASRLTVVSVMEIMEIFSLDLDFYVPFRRLFSKENCYEIVVL